MFPYFRCALSALAGASALASVTAATAGPGWLPSSSCGCTTTVAPVACAPAVQAIPITQQCYQTVPVTEYQQVRQKVRRPITDVEYIEQPVTTYRPVVETRCVDVPVTTCQDVVEYQTVARQGGHWVTNYHCNPKLTACEYDSRPDIFGLLNRTGYAIRSAFTPNVIASRQFVPQTCVAQVPVTRKVPQTVVQRQSYQVTKYVPETTTRRVAVSKVRWVDDEVVALKPVTVMKTVSAGTQTAWTYAPVGSTVISSAPAGASQIGLAPSPDPVSSAKQNTTPKRTAVRPQEDAFDDRDETDRTREAAPRRSANDNSDRTLGSTKPMFVPVGPSSRNASTVARVSGWRATHRIAAEPAPLILPDATTIASTR